MNKRRWMIAIVGLMTLALVACSGSLDAETEGGSAPTGETGKPSTETTTEVLTETELDSSSEVSTEIESESSSEIPSEQETESEATETEAEPPHEHVYTESVTKAPSCTEAGEKIFSCECGDAYTEVIEATGHSYGEYVFNNDATYNADGTQTATCACGAKDTKVASGTKLEYTYTTLNKVMYATADVNIRDLPSADGKRLGGIQKSAKVTVTGQCNETGWYRIDCNGTTAYVSSSYLSDKKPGPTIAATADKVFNTFSVQDLDGKTYTQDTFANAKINIVILSATWCGPCHAELPALESVMKAHSGKSVQFFNIICSGLGGSIEGYKQTYSAITFPTLLCNESIADGYIASMNSYPRILYLDSEGNMLFEVKGSPASSYGVDYAVNYHTNLIKRFLDE